MIGTRLTISGASLLFSFHSFLIWKNVSYVVTDKRVIVRKGLEGIDYEILELVNMQQVNVDVELWDKM
ncbi:MAG TPA: PH domain-containing protein [Thermofilum sp.]|nr:PH domain-containing protein [Thermofilum sp.]